MDSVDNWRERYTSASDAELRAILGAGTTQLTPEARQALMAELTRRRMLADISPLDKLAWPPEVAPAPRYAKASFRKRLGAHIADMVFSSLPILGSAILMLFIGEVAIIGVLGFIAMLASICWVIYYSFTKDGREGGQSVGKKWLDLMVVNVTTNRPCTKGESFIRQLDLFFLQMIPVVGWLVEPVVMLASKDGRRLGDRAANTQVIDVSEYRPNVGR